MKIGETNVPGIVPPPRPRQSWRTLFFDDWLSICLTIVSVLIIAMVLTSLSPRFWGARLAVLWVGGILLMLLLMGGGYFGLGRVPTSQWGGLPVILMLAVLSLGIGFPIAILLALGRRGSLPVTRAICTFIIELVRGLPLVGLLFVAAILLPLFLPPDWTIDKLFRTLVALTIFSSAYLAKGGMTMVVVAHEMGFAKEVADRVVYMEAGEIVETAPPDVFFRTQKDGRTRRFLSRILT